MFSVLSSGPPERLWIAAAGDLNLNSQSTPQVATALEQLMQGTIRFANLEGAIAATPSASEFAIPEKWPQLLKPAVDILNLANNHSAEFGPAGLKMTQKLLAQNKILTVGATEPLVFDKEGFTIAVAARLIEQPREVPDSKLIEEIRKLSETRLVIVSLHWGIRDTVLPMPWQKKYAQALIDAGAHLVWGHGPHSVQGVEIYKDRPIAYSLGNVAFGCDCTQEKDSMILRTEWSSNRKLLRVEMVPIHAGLRGQPPVDASKDASLLALLDELNQDLGTHRHTMDGRNVLCSVPHSAVP